MEKAQTIKGEHIHSHKERPRWQSTARHA